MESFQVTLKWELASRDGHATSEFYVKELMPPLTVSTVACGSKLRHVSSIPGRADMSVLASSLLEERRHVSFIGGDGL